jgi:hypothetical protein
MKYILSTLLGVSVVSAQDIVGVWGQCKSLTRALFLYYRILITE